MRKTFRNSLHQDESLTIRRLADGRLLTVPDNPSECPLLTLLHFDRSSVDVPFESDWDEFKTMLVEIAGQDGIEARFISESDSEARVELVDLERVARIGELDISPALAAAGYPVAAILRANGLIFLGGNDGGVRLQLEESQNAGIESERIVAAVQAVAERFPDPAHTYFSLADFLDKQGDETPYQYGRSLYKYTDCGPWVAFLSPEVERGRVHYESDLAGDRNASWWPRCAGLEIGSIVEGSEVEINPVTLLWPFTEDELEKAVASIDEEAGFYWDRDNSRHLAVKAGDGSWQVYAKWTAFSDEPTAEVEDGDLESDKAIQMSRTAFAWVDEHPGVDISDWVVIDKAGTQVREIDASNLAF